MAFPWAAAISGSSGIQGPIITAWNQSKANEHAFNMNMHAWRQEVAQNEQNWYRDNEYAERVWAMQNQYNEKMWHMMNDYNSPQAQMARYSQAGLNPNLIYGQSNTSGPVSTASFNSKPFGGSSSPKDFSSKTADFGDLGGSAFAAAYNQHLLTGPQVDNLKAQNELIQQQSLNVAADTQSKGVATDTARVNLDNIREYAAKQAQATLSNTNASTNALIDANSRANEMQDTNVAILVQQLEKIKGENVNIDARNQLEAQEAALKQMGIYPGDSKWFKILGALMSKLGLLDKAEDILNLIK